MSNTTEPTYDSEPEADLPVYFWKPDEEHGWASQWYHSPFAARVTLPGGQEREALFPTAEHWMMGQKALLFGDGAIFERIVPSASTTVDRSGGAVVTSESSSSTAGVSTRRTRSQTSRHPIPAISPTVRPSRVRAPAPGAPKPNEVKALGRKVHNFDDAVWTRERERIVLEGTLYKFRQHPSLRAALLATGEREIVEASPRDRVWGIGFGRAGAEGVGREAWGMNLLGRALMHAREVLRGEEPGEGESAARVRAGGG